MDRDGFAEEIQRPPVHGLEDEIRAPAHRLAGHDEDRGRRLGHEQLDPGAVELRQPFDVEVFERGAEVRALAQYRNPAQSRLKAFEGQLLEEPPVVRGGHSPLRVVIGAVVGVGAAPPAAGDAVVTDRLFNRLDYVFRGMDWRVVTLKYGKLLDAAFTRRGGDALRDWIDVCPNSRYSAPLVFQAGGS